MKYKILFSIMFSILAFLKLFLKIDIDNSTIILFVLIFLPWIIEELKEFEITGVGKFKLQNKEKEEIQENAKELEKNSSNNMPSKNSDDFHTNSLIDDPIFLLAKKRFIIEDKLTKLCTKHGLDINKKYGINVLSNELFNNEIINIQEYSLIRNIAGILHRAVHSDLNSSDVESFYWVIKYSNMIIDSLDAKL